MSLLNIDGHKLKQLVISGAKNLNENKEIINSLNVFPVPDGDTGTNMSMTITSAINSIINFESSSVGEVSKFIANAYLKEARGNSGVILSQIFRGFAQGLEGIDVANVKDIANAFTKAMQTAYKAVMKPKEGTILTITRAISEKAEEVSRKTDDIKEMMEEVLSYANSKLAETTEMLPELKQAGVVDAGGKGLLVFLEGVFLKKAELGYFNNISKNEVKDINIYKNLSDVNIKFGYCTEFFINIEKYDENIEEKFKGFLNKIGDSIVVVSGDDFIKVHVHTNNPGKALEEALKIGVLDKVKIENMRIQHTNLIDFNQEEKTAPIKEFGFISVSNGEGFNKIFEEFGVDEIILGGQTMNPSTQDFLNCIEKINAKNIFILPNNKNIILSAKQANELCASKNIIVIETKTIPEAYVALMSFLEENSIDENIEKMNNAIKNISTGQVTLAVRDTNSNDININKDDYISIIDGKICFAEKNVVDATKKMVEKMISSNEDASLVTIYTGEEALKEDIKEIQEYFECNFENVDFEVIPGLQPIYYYIVSVE